ncbi:ShlB/FhaC/HecB family hemolysin secretion/activation protein [Serratia entomophila]|uniref:ShlB/FhaC/HecB family hemolysin secretion/activation protein n=1 Tax=Serratia entomophila TaxID=42906 RepID=UPI00217B8F2A|nr:ShlB/FhaC/HecB family hemolysin secretion/activation protein [Serratia entomophila]CAI1010343.1 Hemolysin transporter protein shlB precursor [Serratia entomophila]CAI1044557.1 Hemolysin transporter protein shlB precursor [Serratia entomophila]CAI1858081.1 Hemolysin transporter protein shlB precursor [Serratia entomophila]CAI1865503.1 Hemolysin transporter protein shlB precursor [Serratia entomophila]CAI1874254.1 Hemolysin transporter protein shlB precursor [Serratia entomophila]
MIRKISTLAVLFSTALSAATLPEPEMAGMTMGESRRALQDSSREINQLIEQRRYQQLKQQRLLAEPEPAAPALPQSAQCLPIAGVYLQGVTLLSPADLSALSALPQQCISSNDINRLSRELTRLYVAKGYITARVHFIRPNKQRELGLRVTEGFIEKIEGGDRWVNSRLLFPGLEGKPLKLTQLDQGLDQANRLQSNTTRLDILPGQQVGGSIIRLRNDHAKPWQLIAGTDNYGQKNTGQWLARATATLDSPFGLSDFVSLNANSTVENPAHRYSRAYTLLYSLPYGAFTFSGFASFSAYENHQQLAFNNVKLHGQTQQYGLRGDYVFYRDRDQIDSLSGQLTYKRIDNYFESVRLEVGSPTLTLAELGVSHLQILPSGVFSANLSVEQGLPLLGADRHPNAVHLDGQFTKGKAFVNLSQRLSLAGATYQLNNLFYGQYSRDPLPGVEWLSLTDRSAIRGFSRSTQSGDNGWYLQNTLSRSANLGSVTLTPRLGADVGRVMPHQEKSGWNSSAGLSAGATLRYRRALADLEVSRGWILSESATPVDPIQVLARFSYTF